MTISAVIGPIGTMYSSPSSQPATLAGYPANTNPEAGPSFFAHGEMLLDPRFLYTYVPGQNFGKQTSGWYNSNLICIDAAPVTATVNNIVAAQTATAGTALTLVSANTTGVTVGVSITRGDTGATVTGLLALDTAQTPITFGSSGTIQVWDPAELISRTIKVTTNGNDASGTYVVRGYDVYGFPLSETITGGNATATTGGKAFKYIASVTPAGTVASTGVTIGTTDVIGLPVRTDKFAYARMVFNNTVVTASTGFTAAVTTAATATSGDVRGTYALQTASDGTKTFQVFIAVPPANATATGIVGVAQFSA